MKEFNLEQALAGKPVVNGYGDSVTQFHLFDNLECDIYCLYAVVDGFVETFTVNGESNISIECDENTLYMAEETALPDQVSGTLTQAQSFVELFNSINDRVKRVVCWGLDLPKPHKYISTDTMELPDGSQFKITGEGNVQSLGTLLVVVES